MIQNLSFAELQKMDQNTLAMLIYLCEEVANNTMFESENDPQ